MKFGIALYLEMVLLFLVRLPGGASQTKPPTTAPTAILRPPPPRGWDGLSLSSWGKGPQLWFTLPTSQNVHLTRCPINEDPSWPKAEVSASAAKLASRVCDCARELLHERWHF